MPYPCRHSGAAIHARVNEPGEEETSGGAGNVVLSRLVAGLEMRRPLASNWTGTAGLNWQRTKCMDEKGQPLQQDCYGAPLTFSGADSDVMMLGLITANYRCEQDSKQLDCIHSTQQILLDASNNLKSVSSLAFVP